MSPEPLRWVDKIPDSFERTKEMEVLCLGLSRTGTLSLYTALTILGYQCYHYLEIPKNAEHNHIRCWLEAMEAKLHGTGKPYGRAEFDKVLGRYNAVTDAPCANHAAELLRAYPKAKVVLNTRDVDKWLPSMETSYYDILRWKPLRVIAFIKPRFLRYHIAHMQLILTDWTSGDWQNRTKLREGFGKHYQHDGWEPLCRFLGKPVPNEPYPRVNEGDSVYRMQVAHFWFIVRKLIVTYVVPVFLAVPAVWFLWWWRNRND